jgi:hypothetical protein
MTRTDRALTIGGLAALFVLALAWFMTRWNLGGMGLASSALLVLAIPLLPLSGVIAAGVVWTVGKTRLPAWLAGAASLLVLVGVYWLVLQALAPLLFALWLDGD